MKKSYVFVGVAVLVAVFSAALSQSQHETNVRGSFMSKRTFRSLNPNQAELFANMRKLWEDHVDYTRLFIVSAAESLPGKDATTARLLQNQVDIGNAIKPIYGIQAGDRLTALLKDHILIAADIVTAAKASETSQVESAKTRWFANSDEIADFLSNANPTHWPRNDMRAMMREHLNITLNEAVAELTGKYPESIRHYDEANQQILMMADMLSTGIILQHPDKFRMNR